MLGILGGLFGFFYGAEFKAWLWDLTDFPKLTQNNAEPRGSESAPKGEEVVVQDLDIPWELVFLPNGDMLGTERAGKLLLINSKTKKSIEVKGVKHTGEGGLLGLALHPKFAENRLLYLYFTYESGGQIFNKVVRYEFTVIRLAVACLDGDPDCGLPTPRLSSERVVLDGIAGSSNHDGGRIAFGPDGYLYIGTGDAESPQLAQDTNSLNGKILRVKDDGSIPEDNPFGNAVYSYGHRNVQGLAWDSSGQLWATEHGPSGLETGKDELNKIERGKNYGWPDSKGDTVKEGTVAPVVHSGKDTWAPSGMVIVGSKIYFAGLRGEAVYGYDLGSKKPSTHFKGEYGRIRTVVGGPNSDLYILTNNTDGRGTPKSGDDKIVRVKF